MRVKIDLRSVCIGMLLTALLACLMGSGAFTQPEEFGRFQIETNSSYAFVLDSATGQVWSAPFSEDSGSVAVPDSNFFDEKLTIHEY